MKTLKQIFKKINRDLSKKVVSKIKDNPEEWYAEGVELNRHYFRKG